MLLSKHNHGVGSEIQQVLGGTEAVFQLPGLVGARLHPVAGFAQRLLGELDLGFLGEFVLVLLREVTGNCSKAHAKRLFFRNEGLDIQNPGQYRAGVERFGSEVLERWEAFRAQNARNEFFIEIRFNLNADALVLTIRNNCTVLPQEWERIETRFDTFRRYPSLESAMKYIRDESEGAGFGIVLSLLMLSNAGIPPENFSIQRGATETITTLVLPRRPGSPGARREFREKVLAEIEGLPSFPEHVARLIRLCDSDLSSVQGIANEIQKDPALTSQLLKMVNSAGYMSRWQNPTLTDAVKIIGLKVLRDLLMANGARNLINAHFRIRDLEELWAGSNRVSFYARTLAGDRVHLAEQAALAGLLHNLGRIVLVSLKPEPVKRIMSLSKRSPGRGSAILEEITLGIAHPEIGGLLGKKWKFPPGLTQAIRYQQRPNQAPAEFRELVRTVYLAIRMHEAGQSADEFFVIEEEILAEFGMNSPHDFLERARSLDVLFNGIESPR